MKTIKVMKDFFILLGASLTVEGIKYLFWIVIRNITKN